MVRITKLTLLAAGLFVLVTLIGSIIRWPPSAEAQTPQNAMEARLDTRLSSVEAKIDKHMQIEEAERLSTRLAIIEDRSMLLGEMMMAMLVASLAQLASYWFGPRRCHHSRNELK